MVDQELAAPVARAYAEHVEDLLAAARPLATAPRFALDISPSGRS